MSKPAADGPGKAVGVGDASVAPAGRSGHWMLGWVPVLVVILAAASSWGYRLSGPLDLRFDAGVYYSLGTSLAAGNGYRIIAEPGAPEGVQYPPGLPVIVAVHQWILGTSDPVIVGTWLKRTYAALFAALGVATLVLASSYLGRAWGTLAAVLCVVQFNTYYLSNLLFTELPYTLVSVCLGLILTSERWRLHGSAREGSGFLLAAAGFALRTAGLALLAAWIAEALFRKQWRTGLIRAALSALPIAGWQLHVARVQQSSEYRQPAYAYQRAAYQFYNVSYAENLKLIDPFQPELGRTTWRTTLARAKANLAVLPMAFGEAASEARGNFAGIIKTLFYPGQKHVAWVESAVRWPVALVALLALVGLIALVRKRAWFPASLIVCSAGLVCSTPWPQQFLRYLAPLGPFMAIILVLGIVTLTNVARGFGGPVHVVTRVGLATVLAGVGVAHAYAFANSFQSMFRVRPPYGTDATRQWHDRRWYYYSREWADWEKAIDWIGTDAADDAIVATSSPHLCFLKIGRRAVMPPMEADAKLAEQMMRDVPVSYVVLDELDFVDLSRRYAEPAVLVAPDRWEPVKRINRTVVYRRTPNGR